MQIPPVKLELKEQVTPKFCKARPIPLALQEEVVSELRAMAQEVILEPVQYATPASPLVVVRKPKRGLRLCVDYKVTLNKYLKLNHYL